MPVAAQLEQAIAYAVRLVHRLAGDGREGSRRARPLSTRWLGARCAASSSGVTCLAGVLEKLAIWCDRRSVPVDLVGAQRCV